MLCLTMGRVAVSHRKRVPGRHWGPLLQCHTTPRTLSPATYSARQPQDMNQGPLMPWSPIFTFAARPASHQQEAIGGWVTKSSLGSDTGRLRRATPNKSGRRLGQRRLIFRRLRLRWRLRVLPSRSLRPAWPQPAA